MAGDNTLTHALFLHLGPALILTIIYDVKCLVNYE